MTRLIIVAHTPLATALKQVAGHTFAEAAAAILAIDVSPDDAPEVVERRVRAGMVAGDDTLILCDAMGATPANASMRAAKGAAVSVVAGVNVPMLWRVLCYASEPLASLTQRAVHGGTGGVLQISQSSTHTDAPTTRHDQQ
jgi:PTS system ascorbate-specific IIA component